MLRQSDLFGRAVIGPAAGIALISGLLLVREEHLTMSTFWVAWGVAWTVLSVVWAMVFKPTI